MTHRERVLEKHILQNNTETDADNVSTLSAGHRSSRAYFTDRNILKQNQPYFRDNVWIELHFNIFAYTQIKRNEALVKACAALSKSSLSLNFP